MIVGEEGWDIHLEANLQKVYILQQTFLLRKKRQLRKLEL